MINNAAADDDEDDDGDDVGDDLDEMQMQPNLIIFALQNSIPCSLTSRECQIWEPRGFQTRGKNAAASGPHQSRFWGFGALGFRA